MHHSNLKPIMHYSTKITLLLLHHTRTAVQLSLLLDPSKNQERACHLSHAEFLTLNAKSILLQLEPAWGKMLLAFKVRKTTQHAWVLSWRREFSGRPLTEFWRHVLSGCQVCDWGIQYHLCSIHRGLWGLVVVQLSWLSGRALAAQARCPGFDSQRLPAFSTCLYFRLITS